jgi:PAS domain S-box-containing protein
MTFNTALAFAVTGTALVLVTTGKSPWAAAAGIFDAALGLLVLAEYAVGHGLGIDQLAVPAYLSEPHRVPGRLAGNTALCFLLVGLGLLAWAPWRRRPRPAAIAVAGSLSAAIALVAAFGYVSSTPQAYGWGGLSRMALLTALAMLALSAGLQCAAWRSADLGPGEVPRWIPVPAGVTALGVAAIAWLAIAGRSDRAGRTDAGAATGAATVIALLMAALVMLVVWLALRARGRTRLAWAEAERRAKAEARAKASESRMFQFLDAIPAAAFATLADGQPYYANQEAVRILGQGLVPDIGGDKIAETYNAFVAGTDRKYPNEDLPVIRATRGEKRHVDDMDIHHPDGSVIPVEVWGTPITGPGGQVEYAIVAFADMTERDARERTIADQAALSTWPTTRCWCGTWRAASPTGTRVPSTPTAMPSPRRSDRWCTCCCGRNSRYRGRMPRPASPRRVSGKVSSRIGAPMAAPSSWRAGGRRGGTGTDA